MSRSNSQSVFGILEAVAIVVVSYSAYLAFAYAHQPPLDAHSFRQTQTALTAYWFTQEGFKWAYETPVGGTPWAIPFEFPIYQLIVASISQILDVPLDFSGRVVSYIFLLLCIFPSYSITRRLGLPNSVFVFFVTIVFSMPIYIYWGRTIMIETAALFFSIVSIKFFIDQLYGTHSIKVALLFVFFSSLAVLQKVTTALPILMVLAVIFLFSELKKQKTVSIRFLVLNKKFWTMVFLFTIPICVGFWWVKFTDQAKILNPLGEQLTSAALSKWNWGTVSQRISYDIWVKVFWERMFVENMGGALGLFLLITPFFARAEFRIKAIHSSTIVLGVLPLFLFTNLHVVHNYYQTANVIFFAYGIAIALGLVILPTLGKATTIFSLLLVVLANYFTLSSGYFPQMKAVFNSENRDVAVGEILKRELPVGMQFVAFGNDWSSTFSYLSQRKSFTVPKWFRKYNQVVSNPENFLDEGRLGGVVSCSVERPNASALIGWASDGRSWQVGETHGCLIATPQETLEERVWKSAQCAGNIDRADIENRNGHRVLSFAGWVASTGENPVIPDKVFIVISSGDYYPIYLQALKVPRLDVNKHLGIPSDIDSGFSRIIPANLKSGDYNISVIKYSGNQYYSCNFNKMLRVG
jgi:hypothetical protein